MSKGFRYATGPIGWQGSPRDYTGDNMLGIYTQEDIQRYVYGTRYLAWDGRVFKYAKCGATLTDMKHGVKNNHILVQENGATVSAAAAGDTKLTVTFNGDYNDGVYVKDELQGGYISIYNTSSVRDQRMIIGNDAIATGGGATTIYLDAPITATFTSSVGCEVMENPYTDLRNINDLQTSVMGMPCSLATATYNFWVQTWGPCRITPTSAELGVNNDERMFHFDAYGGVRSAQASIVTEAKSEQIAGFIIEKTARASGSAAPFIMLQISI